MGGDGRYLIWDKNKLPAMVDGRQLGREKSIHIANSFKNNESS